MGPSSLQEGGVGVLRLVVPQAQVTEQPGTGRAAAASYMCVSPTPHGRPSGAWGHWNPWGAVRCRVSGAGLPEVRGRGSLR